MTQKSEYLSLEKLKVYQLAVELSRLVWQIYQSIDWKTKKIMGDQFIESTDSIGANIAEGSGRFHYLDKIKFYYNARGSLLESQHWFRLLDERHLITKKTIKQTYLSLCQNIGPLLNGLINSTYKKKAS